MIDAIQRLFRRSARDGRSASDWRREGNACLARGELAEAVRCYRAAVAAAPDDTDACLSLGFALLEQQATGEARAWLDQVVRLRPDHHEAHFLLARAARAEGRLEPAAESYRLAVQHAPGFDPARVEGSAVCLALGQRELESGRPEAAREWFEDAVVRHPANAAAHAGLGLAWESLGRPDAATQNYGRALQLEPGHPQALFGLASLAMQRKQPAAAAEHYAKVLEALPGHVPARLGHAQAMLESGRFDDALRCFRELLADHPGEHAAVLGEANALLGLGQHAPAVAAFDRALQVLPDAALAHLNRGTALLRLRRPQEALQGFRRALELHPGYVEALVNIGGVLHDECRFDDALGCFDRALALDPGNVAAHWNRALCLLVQGRFQEGWPEAEWRWQAKGHERLQTGKPQWTGAESLAGRTILVHYEQGLGDTVQFCRYVPLLAQRGADVLLAVQPALENLVRTLPGPFRLVKVGESIPPHDYECPLLSLPRAFGTTLASIPAGTYLSSAPALVAQWRERLGPAAARRIGIAWSGNPGQENDHNRSMPLATLLRIAGEGVQLVSLQKEVRAVDAAALQGARMPHFGDLLTDFEQTAALIECMDVVVTVCTSVAHVAGALGKPTWVVLCHGADWRWLRDRSDSPWYPTARLFRQPRPGDWESVVAEVRGALQG